jgi:hypothetical protein
MRKEYFKNFGMQTGIIEIFSVQKPDFSKTTLHFHAGEPNSVPIAATSFRQDSRDFRNWKLQGNSRENGEGVPEQAAGDSRFQSWFLANGTVGCGLGPHPPRSRPAFRHSGRDGARPSPGK